MFFCAKNIFSSHLAIMATGNANPAWKGSVLDNIGMHGKGQYLTLVCIERVSA